MKGPKSEVIIMDDLEDGKPVDKKKILKLYRKYKKHIKGISDGKSERHHHLRIKKLDGSRPKQRRMGGTNA